MCVQSISRAIDVTGRMAGSVARVDEPRLERNVSMPHATSLQAIRTLPLTATPHRRCTRCAFGLCRMNQPGVCGPVGREVARRSPASQAFVLSHRLHLDGLQPVRKRRVVTGSVATRAGARRPAQPPSSGIPRYHRAPQSRLARS